MYELTLLDLSFALIPVIAVGVIFARWFGRSSQVVWAAARMILQLLLVGYALQYVFAQDAKPLSLAVLIMMIVVSTAIALRHTSCARKAQATLAGGSVGDWRGWHT